VAILVSFAGFASFGMVAAAAGALIAALLQNTLSMAAALQDCSEKRQSPRES
jgi:hypothetical protein